MNSWNGNMAIFNALINRSTIRKMGLTLLTLFSLSAVAQTDRYALGEALDIDLLPVALPSEMEITALNLAAGRVYMDGEGYSIELFLRGEAGLEESRLHSPFDLQELEVGDRVVVETDGTAPTSGHYPFVIAIGRPQ